MKTIKILSIFIFLVAFKANAQSAKLMKLAYWMEGSFSSEQQHIQDPENYYHIKLDIISIWRDRTDGYWFYVEQVVAGSESEPYRQRVYHVFENEEGLFESVILTMENPLNYAQNYLKLESELSPDDLKEKEGCTVYLDYELGVYVGRTKNGTCSSERSGSAYATAEVEIYRDMMYSWDRGWDLNGEQAWGAKKDGYVFIKE